MKGGSCCTPVRKPQPQVTTAVTPRPDADPVDGEARHRAEQAAVPAGSFTMGDAHGDRNPGDGELPRHRVELSACSIDATAVTVADFARFVEATDHRTEAEAFGFSAVFHLLLAADDADVMGRFPGTPWWLGVRGADWRHPGGRHSSVDGLEDHPVTHVSWNDAQAYCDWAGRRLPTEAEWERASRGGLEATRYPWGDELLDSEGEWRCNIWQGEFPVENATDDGHLGTAPVRTFAPNALGLWQTVGNVWEWCADWWDPNEYRTRVEGETRDPRGPATGDARVMRGGSYLCHDSYCNRYRNAARTSNTPDSSSGNTGFRTVAR
jgi:formylglycine-generating enzyme